MKTTLLIALLAAFSMTNAQQQCQYIESTSTSPDTITWSFAGGVFASYGCAEIDPTYWLAGYGATVTVTFATMQNYPSFRIWGMNDDDSASVMVNGLDYPLTPLTANYAEKVVCGLSPGPDGVIFANGLVVGANDNFEGNYSYQDVQLNTTEVSTITVTGESGAGWGFAGVSINCLYPTGVAEQQSGQLRAMVYPNPFNTFSTLQVNRALSNAQLDIYNSVGQLLYTAKNISGNTVQLERNNLPAGIYLLQLTENETRVATVSLQIID